MARSLVRPSLALATVLMMFLAGCATALPFTDHAASVSARVSGDGTAVYRAVVVAAGEPRRDTRTVDDFCDALTVHGWQEDNIYRLQGETATREAILTEPFTWLQMQREDDDDVTLFFFSLHGDQLSDREPLDEPDGLDEYVCPADYNPDDTATFLLDDDLSAAFAAVQSDSLAVVFETCHSGGMLDGTGDLRASGRVILTSCAADETSFPLFFNGRWLFPHYLTQGLRGPADRDGNGRVSAEEAYRYAEPPTVTRSTIIGLFLFVLTPTPLLAQHPQLYDGWPSEADNAAQLDIIPATYGRANP